MFARLIGLLQNFCRLVRPSRFSCIDEIPSLLRFHFILPLFIRFQRRFYITFRFLLRALRLGRSACPAWILADQRRSLFLSPKFPLNSAQRAPSLLFSTYVSSKLENRYTSIYVLTCWVTTRRRWITDKVWLRAIIGKCYYILNYTKI